jgi:hypothetical protein
MLEETYAGRAVAAVKRELPDLPSDLVDLYTLLALTTGEDTTLGDVHNAWCVWSLFVEPGHRSCIPFGQLTPEVQELDRPYRDGIVRAARSLAA